MDYIFVDKIENENKDILGLVENARLVEYYILEDNLDIVGNIYRARVVNLVRGLKAAFVDIGEEKNAYLALESKDKDLKGGDTILVEVKKDAIGDKGAYLSQDISFTGKYLVLTPYDSRIKVSRKISNKKELDRLNKIGRKIINEKLGMVFRTSSIGMDLEVLEDEYNKLVKIYRKIESKKDFLPIPKLLYRDASLKLKIIRDRFLWKDYNIIVSNKDTYKEILTYNEFLNYNLKNRLILDENFDPQYVEEIRLGLEDALSKEINLKSGGSIVIEETEALTSIDVNTGGNVEDSLEGTVFNTNKEAAIEIARQLRLRNLSGIIIVDFIRLKNQSHMNELIRILKKEMKKDSNRPYIIGFTKLGLLEITRKRERNPLSQNYFIECNKCHGRGKIKKY